MAYDFPNSPTLNQTYSGYTWDGEKWVSTPNVPNTAGVISIQVFQNSGTYVPSPNATTCVVEVWGGGGGAGGGAATTAGQMSAGGGGGAGGYARKTITSPVTQALVVGAGGAGGVGNASGVQGGTSSFGAITANGGFGGSGSTNNISANITGSSGGVASGGDININGGAGTTSIAFASPASVIQAVGGAAPNGGGSAAGGSNGGPGNAGFPPGGGGGGAYSYNGTGAHTGGAGAKGGVVITEYGMTALTGPATGAVRYDLPQGLTANQTAQARANIWVTKKNYIVNGAMMLSQETGGTGGTTSGYYAADQWAIDKNLSTGTYSFALAAVPTLSGSPYRLRATVTAAQPSLSGQQCYIYQYIEGFRVADLQWGTAAAKTITIQLGVKAPVAGTYSITVFNSTFAASGTGQYTISAGEVGNDVVKSVTIPGVISGTWKTDNFAGFMIFFYLASASQTANVFATLNNAFELFDVSLTEGSVAPPFQVPDYASELALCQRYFEMWGTDAELGTGQCVNTTGGNITISHTMWKRAAPTVTISAPSTFGITNAGGGVITCTAASVGTASLRNVSLTLAQTSGFVAGNAFRAFPLGGCSIKISARL